MTSTSLIDLEKSFAGRSGVADLGHLIPNCYKYFHTRLDEWLRDCEEGQEEDKFAALYHAVRQDLVLVVVDLGNGDDPQLIFETLNALGTPLQPADLVKNFLFHLAERQGSSTESLYEEIWRSFDDDITYWRGEVRQGRLRWYRIDMFLAHYLTLLRKEVVGMTHLFSEFRDYYTSQANGSAEKHIRQLRNYADTYQRFEEFSLDSREGQFFHRLDALDTNMVYPVLLELFNRQQADPYDRTKFLILLESYLVRRAVCGLTYKNYNRIFVEMIKFLSENGYKSTALSAFLQTRRGDSAEWPTDEAFKHAFCEKPAYRWLKRSRVRMVLESIEYELRGDKTERIILHDKLTVEHILPQQWRDHWPLPDGSVREDEYAREEILHRFGNLTLVNGKLNPALSNEKWSTKKVAIAEHSALALNRAVVKENTWDEDVIARRSEDLFNIALRIWPRSAEDASHQ